MRTVEHQFAASTTARISHNDGCTRVYAFLWKCNFTEYSYTAISIENNNKFAYISFLRCDDEAQAHTSEFDYTDRVSEFIIIMEFNSNRVCWRQHQYRLDRKYEIKLPPSSCIFSVCPGNMRYCLVIVNKRLHSSLYVSDRDGEGKKERWRHRERKKMREKNSLITCGWACVRVCASISLPVCMDVDAILCIAAPMLEIFSFPGFV